MKNKLSNLKNDELLPEYDFSNGVRGKHAEAYQRGYKTTIHRADGSSEERDYTLPEGDEKRL